MVVHQRVHQIGVSEASAEASRGTVMGIVRLALRRPYTFIVMGLLIAVLGISSVLTMSTDIFPDINIPVISVVWTYAGNRHGIWKTE
jgi:hypothetical protein